MIHTKTYRDFERIEFNDLYDKKCSLQQSSLSTDDAIWLGINDPEPKIMAKDAAPLGIITSQSYGWISYPLPKEVSLTTRMHLTREQAAQLIPLLQRFVDTGEL